MPIDAGRKVLTDVLIGQGDYESNQGIDRYHTNQIVKGTATIEPIGIPVVWNGATNAFEVFVAQDISASVGAPNTWNKAKVGIIIGDFNGAGNNRRNYTLNTTGEYFTVLYAGETSVRRSGINFGAATSANQELFVAALAAQGINIAREAANVQTTFI